MCTCSTPPIMSVVSFILRTLVVSRDQLHLPYTTYGIHQCDYSTLIHGINRYNAIKAKGATEIPKANRTIGPLNWTAKKKKTVNRGCPIQREGLLNTSPSLTWVTRAILIAQKLCWPHTHATASPYIGPSSRSI